MWKWLREWYDLRMELAERKKFCQSCDVLKIELNAVRREKEILLDRLLNPDLPTPDVIAPAPVGMPHRQKPWRVKQQELEEADRRKKAEIMAEFRARTAQAEKTMGIE